MVDRQVENFKRSIQPESKSALKESYSKLDTVQLKSAIGRVRMKQANSVMRNADTQLHSVTPLQPRRDDAPRTNWKQKRGAGYQSTLRAGTQLSSQE